MKTRMGFVSNSSSSSFILDVSKLTKRQIHMVENHIEFAKVKADYQEFYIGPYDGWSINKDNGDKWYIHTTMDNFDMLLWLRKYVKVPEEFISDIDQE